MKKEFSILRKVDPNFVVSFRPENVIFSLFLKIKIKIENTGFKMSRLDQGYILYVEEAHIRFYLTVVDF